MNNAKKLFLIFISAVLVLGLVGCGASYTRTEEHAISCVKRMKSLCKSPTSFVLDGDVLVFTSQESAIEGSTICYFEYSAQNSYGVLLADNAVFCNGDYLGSEEDIEDYLDDAEKDREKMDSREDIKASLENSKAIVTMLKDLHEKQFVIQMTNTIPSGAEMISEKTINKALK